MAKEESLVAAIDFGTTYSGWCVLLRDNLTTDPTKALTREWFSGTGSISTEKTPTVVLIKEDGKTLEAFGYEAENRYRQLVKEGNAERFYYFRRFKLFLMKEMGEKINLGAELEDEMGRSLPARTVFSVAIQYLVNDVQAYVKSKVDCVVNSMDIKWVITVPAIWTDPAKKFMRLAAEKAGISSDKLLLALEPECASIFCQHLPVDKKWYKTGVNVSSFPVGTKYMIIDAGGGIVDIAVHEIQESGKLKEITAASGGNWGGILVDQAFEDVLIEIIGEKVYKKLKSTDAWLELWRDFELTKREFKHKGVIVKVPVSLLEMYHEEHNIKLAKRIKSSSYNSDIKLMRDKLKCEGSFLERLYDRSTRSAIDHVKQLLAKKETEGVKTIIMIGGFSESTLLQERIKNAFSAFKVVVPKGAAHAVLNGSAIFGFKPDCISERVLQFTFQCVNSECVSDFDDGKHPGNRRQKTDRDIECKTCFPINVEIDRMVKTGERQTSIYYTLSSTQKSFELYASNSKDPKYTTLEGWCHLETFSIPLSDPTANSGRKVCVSVTFSGTEIEAEGRDERTETVTKAKFRLPGAPSLAVAAIDFGTTYSGWSFLFHHDLKTDPTKAFTRPWYSGTGGLSTEKTPTVVLIKEDGCTLEAFGYEAENKYRELVIEKDSERFYYFRRFKMMLMKNSGEKITERLELEDEMGRSLPAITVFSLAIKYLVNDVHTHVNSTLAGGIEMSEIKWVLTVPAIWTDSAKKFMRLAAEKAGISRDKLRLALEPESASIFCQHLPLDKRLDTTGVNVGSLPVGTKYMIIDAGGGTVDITVHEIQQSGKLKEITAASGGGWGSTLVDQAFEEVLIEIIGANVYTKFKEESMEDWLDLWREFELKKREFKGTLVTIRIPPVLTELYRAEHNKELSKGIGASGYGDISLARDKMRCKSPFWKGLYDKAITSIIHHIQEMLEKKEAEGVKTLIMVGGFSGSSVLQERIKKSFSDYQVVIPQDAASVVMRGAPIFGFKPECISERVLQYTFGFKTSTAFIYGKHPVSKRVEDDRGIRCKNIFSKHVEIDQVVKTGEQQKSLTYHPTWKNQECLAFALYFSNLKDPDFTDDAGCWHLETFDVRLTDHTGGLDRKVCVSLTFSGTEIEAEGREENTGKITKATFRLPE